MAGELTPQVPDHRERLDDERESELARVARADRERDYAPASPDCPACKGTGTERLDDLVPGMRFNADCRTCCGHLPECTEWSLAERYPDDRPIDVSPEAWAEIRFVKCADGCPILAADIARGHELAERFGW